MSATDLRIEREVGRAMEQVVTLSLQRKGWLILPTVGIDCGVVTPEQRFWAAVKYQQAASYTILTHRYEHGIGLVAWRHYWAIQERTKSEVWLFVAEGKTGLLLSQSLTRLQRGARLYAGPKMDPGGMIFFDRAAFVQSTDIPALPNAPSEGQPRLQYRLW